MEFKVGQIFTGKNEDGKLLTRKVYNIIGNLVYYSVATGKGAFDEFYVLNKRTMTKFVEDYCD